MKLDQIPMKEEAQKTRQTQETKGRKIDKCSDRGIKHIMFPLKRQS